MISEPPAILCLFSRMFQKQVSLKQCSNAESYCYRYPCNLTSDSFALLSSLQDFPFSTAALCSLQIQHHEHTPTAQAPTALPCYFAALLCLALLPRLTYPNIRSRHTLTMSQTLQQSLHFPTFQLIMRTLVSTAFTRLLHVNPTNHHLVLFQRQWLMGQLDD